MNTFTRNILKAINQQSILDNSVVRLGDMVFDYLPGALLIDLEHNEIYYFSEENNKVSYFIEIVDYIKRLDQNGHVYVENTTTDFSINNYILFYKDKEKFEKSSDPNVYLLKGSQYCHDNIILDITNYVISIDGEKTYYGKKLHDSLFSTVKKYCTSFVFPLPLLDVFIKNKFKTIEECALRQGKLGVSVAIVVAILSLVLSPLLSLYLNNKKGISTLNERQYDVLVSKQDTIIQTQIEIFNGISTFDKYMK